MHTVLSCESRERDSRIFLEMGRESKAQTQFETTILMKKKFSRPISSFLFSLPPLMYVGMHMECKTSYKKIGIVF